MQIYCSVGTKIRILVLVFSSSDSGLNEEKNEMK